MTCSTLVLSMYDPAISNGSFVGSCAGSCVGSCVGSEEGVADGSEVGSGVEDGSCAGSTVVPVSELGSLLGFDVVAESF